VLLGQINVLKSPPSKKTSDKMCVIADHLLLYNQKLWGSFTNKLHLPCKQRHNE